MRGKGEDSGRGERGMGAANGKGGLAVVEGRGRMVAVEGKWGRSSKRERGIGVPEG